MIFSGSTYAFFQILVPIFKSSPSHLLAHPVTLTSSTKRDAPNPPKTRQPNYIQPSLQRRNAQSCTPVIQHSCHVFQVLRTIETIVFAGRYRVSQNKVGGTRQKSIYVNPGKLLGSRNLGGNGSCKRRHIPSALRDERYHKRDGRIIITW